MTAQKRALIVNADDLGWAPGRDRGIVRAIDYGIVTSVSLLANGDTFAAAATQIRQRHVGIGVHLNLSEGRALGGYINGLTDADGNFRGKQQSREIFGHAAFDPGAALRELKLQVEAVLSSGLAPDHVDYHQHMGIFPSTLPLVLEVCRHFGIAAARFSCPAENAAFDPGGTLGNELHLYRRFAPRMRAQLQRAGLLFPAAIWGMPLLNRLNLHNLEMLLHHMPAGCWELMVHPGYEDAGIPFCGAERRIELEALTAVSVREICLRRGIGLITFGDLHAYPHLLA
jgi:predicted glycoside hydrolase/deacetylase ChbG (UPF0249 family)